MTSVQPACGQLHTALAPFRAAAVSLAAAALATSCAEQPPMVLRQHAPVLHFSSTKSVTAIVDCVTNAQLARHTMQTVRADEKGTSITDYDSGYLLSVTDIRDTGTSREVSFYTETSPKLMMNRRRTDDVSSCR